MRSIQEVTKELSGRKCHFSGQFFLPQNSQTRRLYYPSFLSKIIFKFRQIGVNKYKWCSQKVANTINLII